MRARGFSGGRIVALAVMAVLVLGLAYLPRSR